MILPMQRKTRWMILAGGSVALVAVAALGLAAAHGGAGSATMPFAGPGFGFRGAPEGWGHGGWGAGFTEANGTVTGRAVTFTADPTTGTLTNVDLAAANGTHPLLASIQMTLPAGATGAEAVRGAYALRDGAGDALMVQDSPRGEIRATSVNGTTVTLTLPADASVIVHDAVADWSPAGATVTYANGEKANLVLGENATLTVSGQVVTVTLGPRATLDYGLLPPPGAHGFPGGPHEGFFGRGGPEGGFRGRR